MRLYEHSILETSTAEHDRGRDGGVLGDEGFHWDRIGLFARETPLLDAYEEYQGRGHLLASGEYNLVVCTPINFEKARVAWMLFH